MYVIAFVGIAITLFLGAEDRIGELEKIIADLQEKLDEITPELNEMNTQVTAQQTKVDKLYNNWIIYDKQLDAMDRDDHQYGTIEFLRGQARSEWIQERNEGETMASIRDALQEKANTLLLEQELHQKSLDRLLEQQKPKDPKKVKSNL